MFEKIPGPALIIIYIVLAALICFFSKKLADYVDALDKKTKISGAFIGAVLLAAVTSLPELFTSISATILLPESANLVVGNILGSNLFDLAIIGIAMVLFFKLFAKAKIEYKSHFTVLIGVGVIYAIIAYGLLGNPSIQPIFAKDGYWSNINLLALLIIIVYIITVTLQPKEQEENDEEEKDDPYEHLTLKRIIICFFIFSLLLVAASVFITYTTDAIAKFYTLDATLAGAIFLAIATSLPELVSTLTLCKKGNFNAALGDIVGSCLFNFIIIGIAEFMAYKSSLLPGFINTPDIKDAIQMLYLTVGVLIFLTLSLLVNFFSTKKNKVQGKMHYAVYIISGIALLSGYIIFLII